MIRLAKILTSAVFTEQSKGLYACQVFCSIVRLGHMNAHVYLIVFMETVSSESDSFQM